MQKYFFKPTWTALNTDTVITTFLIDNFSRLPHLPVLNTFT